MRKNKKPVPPFKIGFSLNLPVISYTLIYNKMTLSNYICLVAVILTKIAKNGCNRVLRQF